MAETPVKEAPKKAKAPEPSGRWYLVDAQGKVLGRMAVRVARVLMGKHKPTYQPDQLMGDEVIVINADKIVVTGKKLEKKFYTSYSGYPGGLKKRSLGVALAKDPEFVIRHAVGGMLPKNRLGSRMLKRLKVYRDAKHPHESQKPEPMEI